MMFEPRTDSLPLIPTLVCIFAVLSGGCAVGPRNPVSRSLRTDELGRSVNGIPIEAVVFPGRKPGILIVGGIHGNERSSSFLVSALAERLENDPAGRGGREVVLIPRANPDGLQKRRRRNAHGIDLNRNFDTWNFRPGGDHGTESLCEPETRALLRAIVRYSPACVVSVHAPLGCVDPDGGEEARKLAEKMSAAGSLPVRDLKPLPGSMGSYVGYELDLEMITYELDRKEVGLAERDSYFAPHIQALMVAIAEW